MNVHEILKQLVEIRQHTPGLRQVDVAEKMGVGQPAISELERGTKDPHVSTLERYAASVGYRIEYEIVEVD